MSGHSKWSTIKRSKEANDLKKAKNFTKVLNQIFIAVKYGGDDVDNNLLLKSSIDMARSFNVPSKSIENAIKKGKGEDKLSSGFESIFYEAYGPGSVSILIDCFTDNKNRLISEIRTALDRNGGKIVNNGTLGWQFELQMLFTIKIETQEENKVKLNYHTRDIFSKINDKSQFESDLLDIEGIIDYHIDEDTFYIYVFPEKTQSVKDCLEGKKLLINSIEKIYVSKNKMSVSEENMEKIDRLIDLISNIDNVENVYINI